MKNRILAATCVALAMASAGAAAAQDRSIGEDAPWRFKTANDRAVQQNGLTMFELNKAGYFDQIQAGNLGALAGAGGLLGGSAANTNNVFNFVDQSVTTNNCTSSGSGVGSTLTCGRGDNVVTGVTQTSTGNTQDANTNITGNTVTNRDNQTQTNLVTGNGGQNVTSGPAGRPNGGQ